eukprot:scaffold15788_cov98-Skeletonema_marinoi.AAC.2
MDSSDDDSSSSSSSSDSSSQTTSVAKPFTLDPDTVRALAVSTGCQELMIDEQNINRSRSTLRYATTSSSNDDTLPFDTTQTTSDDEEDPYVDPSPTILGKSFSIEKEGYQKQSPREKEHILSFFALDPLSVEQLAADASNGKKKSSTELYGAGVARVDVYCLSGTVIVSRMVTVLNYDSTSSGRINSEGDSRSISSTKASSLENTRIRRIIRQNVTLETLRCIFSNPPKVTTFDESLCSPMSNDKDHVEEKVDEDCNFEQDELARMHAANAVIDTAVMGIGGDDLERVKQFDSFSNNPPDAGKTSKLLQDETDQLLSLQLEVQKKIEIADIGLAILMAERDKLEKFVGIEKGAERKKDTDESLLEEDVAIQDDADNVSAESESSRSLSCDYDEAEKRAYKSRYERISVMGCEVEYSFASSFVDDLEAALMGQLSNDDDSSDSDDSIYGVSRGRSKTKRKILPGESIPIKRQLRLSAIASIPTNGDGCVVLRENGAFNVVGHIPKNLEERLFRDDAPFPEYISLGSSDRYFVKFDDETYYFHGPPSLSRTLNKKMVKKQKVKDKKGTKNSVSIASVAFGREFDVFFVVFTDGSWECDGELHEELDKLLNDRGNRDDLVWVSLGPDDEFCLKAKNGRIWWGGVSDEISELLFDITDGNENEVDYISFGVEGSYFLTHRGNC